MAVRTAGKMRKCCGKMHVPWASRGAGGRTGWRAWSSGGGGGVQEAAAEGRVLGLVPDFVLGLGLGAREP